MTFKAEIVREVNGVIIKEPRKIIKFENGYYETTDKEEIAFIKKHVDFGNGNICVVEGKGDLTPKEPKIEEEPKKPKKRGRAKKVE